MPVQTAIECPHCHGLVEVTVTALQADRSGPARNVELYDKDGRVNVAAKRAIAAMLRRIGPGRYTMQELLAYYEANFVVDNAPSLGPRNFAAVLRMLKCEPYRTAKVRGYIVPEAEAFAAVLDLSSVIDQMDAAAEALSDAIVEPEAQEA